MSNDKIEKGRHVLRMRMKATKGKENPDSDLMKIPLEALHRIALQQIGEQEAYIEELEARLKESEKVYLTRKDNVRIAEETRREEVISRIWKRFNDSQQRNGVLQKKYKELSAKYVYCLTQNSMLQERIEQLEGSGMSSESR